MASDPPLPPSPPPPPPPSFTVAHQSVPVHNDDKNFEIKEFSHKITEKLHDGNFLLWRQQVEPCIKAHRLHHFLVCPRIPPRFLSEQDRQLNCENPEYSTWEAQDQMLFSWLQTSLTTAIQSRVLGCVHTFELWDKIHVYFQKLMRTKARQIRTELCNTRLESRTVADYLSRIKTLVDSLASVGDPVSAQEHLDVILEGLP